MKLNPDCIRDILLSVEDACDFNKKLIYSRDTDIQRLQKYSHDEIIYHIRQCKLSELIIGSKMFDGGESCIIGDLSPAGHELLAKIRDNHRWKDVKKGLTAVRDFSLSAISAVAEGVASAAINAYFANKTDL